MILLTAAILATTTLVLIYHRIIYILFKTLPRDIRGGLRFAKIHLQLLIWEKQNKTVVKIFQGLARKHPQKVAFYFEDEVWTYQDVEEFTNKIANYFKKQGFERGDTIALLLESQPEYACIWLGLAKIGVVTALINNNLVAEPLIHSITVSKAKALIYGATFNKVISDLGNSISFFKRYQLNSKVNTEELLEGATNLRNQFAEESSAPPLKDISLGSFKDKLLYIYTSGTTGLPKAAVITNVRYCTMAMGLGKMICIRPDDIVYDPLPLYHSAGGLIGVGQVLLCGASVVLKKKFSASNFWGDCIKYKCTVAQYIGETCRYILAAHSKNDKPIMHNVRMMMGNGLRPQIWNEFQKKFKVESIYEFYGATEGNSNLVNIDNRPGAVGFLPLYTGPLYPLCLIKCDEATGEPIRTPEGFCMKCKPGEPGIFIGKINPKVAVNAFTGYADKKATQKKVLTNVFHVGDMYFNSGDILIQDEFGYFYFKDRTGDTYRWKGENVATSEVEAVISNIVNYKDATVYGVAVPGTEGRAGMAAIVDTDKSLDVNKLAKGLKSKLPSYAIPLFLRVMPEVPLTGTFKLKKTDLQAEGFDVLKLKDHFYFYDAKNVTYVPLTEKLYEDIMSGVVKL